MIHGTPRRHTHSSAPNEFAFECLTVPLAADTVGGVQMCRLLLPVDSDRTLAHPGAHRRPVDRWGYLYAHADEFVVVAVPVHTAALLEDGQCAGLDVGTLKVEPEIHLQVQRL